MARVHVTQEEANGDRILASYAETDVVALANAYPQATLSAGNSGANVTSYPIPLPDNLVEHDLIAITLAKDASPGVTWPTSPAWNSGPDKLHTNGLVLHSRWRRVDGTEGWGGTGNSISVTCAAADGMAHALAKIASGTYWLVAGQTPITMSDPTEVLTGTSAAPDPPLLDPLPWASENTLWMASYVWNGDVSHVSYPDGYTTDQITSRWAHADGVGVALATRERNVSLEDPGAAALSASQDWIAMTWALRPKTTDPTTKQASTLAVNDVLASGGVVIAVHTAEGDV